MEFEEALKLLKEGKKIRRQLNKNFYLHKLDEMVNETNIRDGTQEIARVCFSDLITNDWEEYKEEGNWSLEKSCLEEGYGYHFQLDDIKKLKQKILEDIRIKIKDNKKEIDSDELDYAEISKILEKRFGFKGGKDEL